MPSEATTTVEPQATAEPVAVAAEVTSQLVPVELIDEPKVGKDERSYSAEKTRTLAKSIQTNGLLQPVGLLPKADGRYDVVWGITRFRAHKLLKREVIEAKVCGHFDADDADLARWAENLHRSDLSKAQTLCVIRKYSEALQRKYPDLVGRKAAAAATNKAKGEPEVASASLAEAEPAGDPGDAPAPEPTSIIDMVAATTGKSRRSTERDLRITKSLTDDQLAALEASGVSRGGMESVAGVKDDAARAKAVNLVASGMEVEAAIAAASPPPPGAARSGDDMTDEEWIAHFCGDIRGRIRDPKAFDRSAALYRKIRPHREKFVKEVKAVMTLYAAAEGSCGPFYRFVRSVVNAAHPRDWLLCGECKGQGRTIHVTSGGLHQVCGGCKGDGFRVKMED